jgi:cytochrome b6-f complex iron-sulfur subunit
MDINRRQFLILTAATVATGCHALNDGSGSNTTHTERVVDAGPADNYAADGVYTNFHDQGFFVIRNGEKLFALSAICTHRKCRLIAEPNRSFYCKCHGSTFDPSGKVTLGPAKRDLPVLPSFVNEQGQLLVTVEMM